MKPYLLLLILSLCTAALADDKPLATQMGEAMAPYTLKAAEAYSETMLEFMTLNFSPFRLHPLQPDEARRLCATTSGLALFELSSGRGDGYLP